MSTSSVAIVGAGAIGTALAHAFAEAGVSVAAIASRTPERAGSLARRIPGSQAVTISEAARAAPVILLTVADSAIEAACAALDAPRGALVAHASGSRDVGALAVASANGAAVGGFHPLAAVARGTSEAAVAAQTRAGAFRGAVFAIEGDCAVTAALSELARAIGGEPFPIVARDKPLYHLGASMLAAFAAGLAQISWDQVTAAGASSATASRGVAHLLRTVADNIELAPTPAAALTGPVARGDAGGVQRQARAARALSGDALALYRAHVAHNIAVAHAAGTITADVAARLREALREDETTERPHERSG